MIRFHADRYLKLVSMMGQLEGVVATATGLGAQTAQKQTADVVSLDDGSGITITDLKACVEDLELRISAAQLERITEAVRERRATIAEFGTMVKELRLRIVDELGADVFVRLPRETGHYFDDPKFSPAIPAAFPSAVIDIEEAARCLALARNTACVLHLMRAVEPVIHALAHRLGVRYEYRGWDPVIKKMRTELDRSYDAMDASMKGKKQFFSDALDRLTGLKDALRNPTMHARINYDAERAHDVYRAVRNFMGLCASELSELEPAVD